MDVTILIDAIFAAAFTASEPAVTFPPSFAYVSDPYVSNQYPA